MPVGPDLFHSVFVVPLFVFLFWAPLSNLAHLEAQTPYMETVSDASSEEQGDLLFVAAEEHAQAGNWLAAALGYEHSASLRAAGDSRRAKGFAAAAEAYRAGGYTLEAAQMSVAAGRAAEEQGAIALAAESFRNAALLNAEEGKSWLSSAYGLRACRLIETGSLSSDDRRELHARFGCPR